MAKVTDVLERVSKVDDSIEITLCGNGYMVKVDGEDTNEDWCSDKIICANLEEVLEVLTFVSVLPKR